MIYLKKHISKTEAESWRTLTGVPKRSATWVQRPCSGIRDELSHLVAFLSLSKGQSVSEPLAPHLENETRVALDSRGYGLVLLGTCRWGKDTQCPWSSTRYLGPAFLLWEQQSPGQPPLLASRELALWPGSRDLLGMAGEGLRGQRGTRGLRWQVRFDLFLCGSPRAPSLLEGGWSLLQTEITSS